VTFSLLVVYGLLQLSRSRTFQLFGEIVARVETTENVVALTFDDGPTPEFTEEILTILEETGTPATFFLTGREITQHLEQAQQIVKAGHEVGNHSWSHKRMVLKSSGFVEREITRTDRAIAEAGYTSVTLFRPPYGKKLFTLPWYLARKDRTSITWDVEPESFPQVAAVTQNIAAHVVENVRPGSVILLHVMYDKERKSMQAVKPIVDTLRAKGYRFVTVSGLLALNPAYKR
jgi:peptidoglycan/xylan/chitin deacetylase (PgdA/CDA1 family)